MATEMPPAAALSPPVKIPKKPSSVTAFRGMTDSTFCPQMPLSSQSR